MIKDLIYELSISEQSEAGTLGIALTYCRESESSVPDIPEAQLPILCSSLKMRCSGLKPSPLTRL